MYTIYINGIKFYDPKIPMPEYALKDPVWNPKVNAAGSLTFTINKDNRAYDKFDNEAYEIVNARIRIYKNNKITWEGHVLTADKDKTRSRGGEIKVYCEGKIACLNNSYQPPKVYKNTTADIFLRNVLYEHNKQQNKETMKLQLRYCSVEDDLLFRDIRTNFEKTSDIFQELIRDNGGYINQVSTSLGNYIDYFKDAEDAMEFYGKEEKTIRLGKEIVSINSKIDTSEFCTAVLPIGKKLGIIPEVGNEYELVIKKGVAIHGGKELATLDEGFRTSEAIDVTPGKTYYYTGKMKEGYELYSFFWRYYDAEGKMYEFIAKSEYAYIEEEGTLDTRKEYKIVAPENAQFVRVSSYNDDPVLAEHNEEYTGLERYVTVQGTKIEVDETKEYFVYDDTLVELFGWIPQKISFDNVEDSGELRTKAEQYLNIVTQRSGDIIFLDPEMLGGEGIELLDTIVINNDIKDIPNNDFKLVVEEMKIPLDKPEAQTIKFGARNTKITGKFRR